MPNLVNSTSVRISLTMPITENRTSTATSLTVFGCGPEGHPHVIRRIRRKYAVGFSSGQLSKEFNIPRSTVLNILDGKLCRSTGGPIRNPNFRYYGNRFKKAIPRKS